MINCSYIDVSLLKKNKVIIKENRMVQDTCNVMTTENFSRLYRGKLFLANH